MTALMFWVLLYLHFNTFFTSERIWNSCWPPPDLLGLCCKRNPESVQFLTVPLFADCVAAAPRGIHSVINYSLGPQPKLWSSHTLNPICLPLLHLHDIYKNNHSFNCQTECSYVLIDCDLDGRTLKELFQSGLFVVICLARLLLDALRWSRQSPLDSCSLHICSYITSAAIIPIAASGTLSCSFSI